MSLLLIHTGGTIGMAPGPEGLTPVRGLVEAALKDRLPAGTALESEVFDPLLDSASVGPGHWNRMVRAIRARPGADVIQTHGTDTMAFTGAALDQALAGSGRRVILCGSMAPLGMGGDAEANLDLAVRAASEAGPGVWLAFGRQLLPAGSLAKTDSHAEDAFIALPRAPVPAGTATGRPFDPEKRLAILTLSPGIPAKAVAASLAELDAAVLRVFGAGTVMDDADLLAALAAATARGIRLRAVSQCLQGGLEAGAYAAGAGLWAAGVENGGIETPEAALIRLWQELSSPD